MTEFSLDALRRWPDVEAPNLVAADASDRLILDEADDSIRPAAPGEVVVIGDRYGALTLGAAELGARGIRVHQDELVGELALAANAQTYGLTDAYTSLPLTAELVAGARVVLIQLPREFEALDQIATLIAAHAAPDVRVFAGGRVKHMSPGMNDVMRRSFTEVVASLARQKSRVLRVWSADAEMAAARLERWPVTQVHSDVSYSDAGSAGDAAGARSLTVAAHGSVFAGTRIDIGTRYLLSFFDQLPERPEAVAIDLGTGTGILATSLAMAKPGWSIIASDQSAAAVASARATADANGVGDRVTVVRDDALSTQADASADVIVLNPPFHTGAVVHTGVARKLFADAGRVLKPGGELWTVWNSHLAYKPVLESAVGATEQVGRNAKFTVARSVKGA